MGCPDLILAETPGFFLKSLSIATQEAMTNGELKCFFVAGCAVIAPNFGRGSLRSKTTSFEIDSRLSEQSKNSPTPTADLQYLPTARAVALDQSTMA